MREAPARPILLLLLLVLQPPTAGAQTPGAPPLEPRLPRGFATIAIGAQATRADFVQAVDLHLYGEPSGFEAAHDLPPGVSFTVDGGARVWRSLGIAVAVSRWTRTGEARLSADIPHPHFFDRRRPLDASQPGLGRQETAVHAGLLWMHRPTPRLMLDLAAGPTLVAFRQHLVTRLALTERYPYDEVGLSRAVTIERQGLALGAHAAGDLFYRLTRTWAVGGGARFSRAIAQAEPDSDDSVPLDTGGLQLTGGIRWVF